ncbi:MAG: hypothetical protein NUV65_05020 [Candidatus Roizmanbacteria bacterium]|nr:hypothetical protein [Candidatus Roizmanbacteria bacterium]
MRQLLIATRNKAKLLEIKNTFSTLSTISVVDLSTLNISQEAKETATTFKENAKLKATFFANISRLPTLADDAGIEIQALNGEPGVRSRRWLGYEASDEELIHYTLSRLKGVEGKERAARLTSCISVYIPTLKRYIYQQESIDGSIAKKPSSRRVEGYPYRSVFIVDAFNKYYDELSPKEHDAINHRVRALKNIIPQLNNLV